MNIVTVYGMMQRLSKKFKDTTGLIKSLTSDYLMATSDLGRKILFGPISTLTRMVRLPAENNMVVGTEVLTILNTDATYSALLFTNDMSKLLCVVKPGGGASIGLGAPGSYSIYQKTLLDTCVYYERQELYNPTGYFTVNPAIYSGGTTFTASLSENVTAVCANATYQYSWQGGNQRFVKVCKWDATNNVFRYSNSLVPVTQAFQNGASGPNVKIVAVGPTTFVAACSSLTDQGWGFGVGMNLTTYSVTVGADGVDPIITQTNTQQLGSLMYTEGVWNTQSGTAPNLNGVWELYPVSSTSFALSMNHYDAYANAMGNIVIRYTVSAGVPTATHSVVQAGALGQRVGVIGFETGYLGLVYLESSKLRGQIWQPGGTLGALVDISANNVAHNNRTLGLSSTTGVVSYLDSNSPSVYKVNIVTRSGTTFVPNTAIVMPYTATDLRFESATAFVYNGQVPLTIPLGVVTMTAHSVYDVTGGNTATKRSEYKMGDNIGCRGLGSGRIIDALFPRNVSGATKTYWMVVDKGASKYGASVGMQFKMLTETGGIISAETDGTGFGGFPQAV